MLQCSVSYIQKRSCKWLHHVIFFQSPHHDAQTLPQRRCLDHAGGSATEMLGPCQGRHAKPCRRVSMDDHGEGCDASERITMLELAFCFASTGQIQSWNHCCFLLQPISELETQLIFATTRSFFCYNRCRYLLQSSACSFVAHDNKQLQPGDEESCNPRCEKLQPATKKLPPTSPEATTGVQKSFNHRVILL